MLVLARKENEAIHIGENIIVKVVSIDNGIVKLGIEAPKDVAIVRNELIEEVMLSNQAASQKADSFDLAALSKILTKSKE